MPAPSRTTRAHRLRSFHDDEGGLESLQTVIVVAIAALILVGLFAFWGEIKIWFKRCFGGRMNHP